MQDLTNIKQFDLYVGKILAYLYAKFPCRAGFDYSVEFGECDVEIMRETLIFLQESEFITIENFAINMPACENVRLSIKGLELLKQTPKSLKSASTIGDYLKQAASTGADAIIQKAANETLSLAVSFLNVIKGA